MPSSKSARKRMHEAVNDAIASGNAFLANEITANVMVGTTMMIIVAVMMLCLILNEVGVFTADKSIMRWAVVIATVIELPITVLNSKYVGTKKWLKVPLMVDLILVCAILSATLGHNVTLAMVFPVVVSTRYFDEKYTRIVAWATAVAFAAASFVNGFYGIINLNMMPFPNGAELSVLQDGTLRDAVLVAGFDKAAYIKSLFLNDFIPRCLIFLALSVSCRYVAGRGKRMIEMQSESAKKASQIETELSLATNIQANMLPRIFPAFPERSEIELYASMVPAKEVGGDFYDFFMVDDDHLAIVMADVSGKGVPAALFMVIAKTLIKDHTMIGNDLGDVFTKVNELLCESNSEGLFVTAFEGVLNLRTGEFRFVNAGHEMPFICKKGQTYKPYKIKAAFVLAGIEEMTYQSGVIQLDAGDKLFQYTDGVTEATNAANELYGMERLEAILTKNADTAPADLLPAVKADIDAFVGEAPQFDDITMLCLEFKEKTKSEE